MNDKQDLTQGGIADKLVRYFLPIAAGTLFQQLYNAVDAVIVGKFVGTVALAAVGGSASHIINLIISFFTALAGGAAVVIAQFFGARDESSMRRATGTAVAFCIAVGAVLGAVCIAMSRRFLLWTVCPEDTLEDAVTYLHIYFAGTVLVLLFNMESGVLRAVGDSRSPFIFLFICCLCNIGLDLVFVICFDMAVAGVAYATVISQFISVILTTWRLCTAKGAYRLELRNVRFNRRIIGKMMHLGVPAGLQESMFGIANLILQVAVNLLGTTAVAAWTLSSKIDGFYWALVSAAGMAITNFSGQNFGANRLDRVRQCEKVGLRLFVAITVGMSALLLTAGRAALPLFTDDQAVVDATWIIMRNIVPFYFLWTYIEVISGVLRGVGDVVPPVIICGLGACLLRILWVVTVYAAVPTLQIVTLAFPVSWIVSGLAFMIYFRRGKWQRIYKA